MTTAPSASARSVARFHAVPFVLDALDADQLGGHGHRLVDRNGEADALGAGPHGHVDADHFAVDVQQRSAGIAGVDAGVGLDQVVVALRIADLHRAVQGADDAAGDGVLVAIGVAHGDDRFADHQIARGAERDDRQLLRHVDLDHRQVVDRIGGNQLGHVIVAVGQRDFDLLHAVDDVEVGDDVAALVDDDAGAHAVYFARAFDAACGSSVGVSVFWP